MTNIFRRIGFVAILLAAYALFRMPEPAMSQDDRGGLNDGCQPLDVVFIIDQSNSMSNTDQQSRRIDAVNNLVERLYENSALRCLNIVHRTAIVDFGSTATVRVPLTSIGFESTDDLAHRLRSESADLRSKINAINNMDQTRFLPAFQLAEQLLSEAAPVSSDAYFSNPRRSAIILLTDGDPCAFTKTGVNPCGNPEWVEHYFYGNKAAVLPDLSDLGDPFTNYADWGFDASNGLINALTGLIPPQRIVHVLLFNNDSVRQSSNNAWTEITRQFGGQYFSPEAIKNTTQITPILSDLMDNLLEIDNQPINCTDPFYVEPYQGSALILSAVREGQSQITVIDPNGNEVRPANGLYGDTRVDYVVLPTVERYLLVNPIPGAWHITGPGEVCSDITADFETIAVDRRVLTSPSAVVVEHSAPFTIDQENHYAEIELLNRLGDPFAELPGYPLTLCGWVQGPPSVQAQLNSLPCIQFTELRSDERPGVWRSTTPVPAPTQGIYTLHIDATAESVNPNNPNPEVQIFSLTTTYETAPPVDVHLSIVEPTEGQIIPINQLVDGVQINQPFRVAVEFRDAEQTAQPMQRIFDASDLIGNAVTASLYYQGNLIEMIPLKPAQSGNSTQLTGHFREGQPVDPEGEYTITFELTALAQAQYNSDNYRIVQQTGTVNVNRRQLRGVKLEPKVPVAPAAEGEPELTLPVNGITDDGVAVPEPINVTVVLVDQSGKNLSPLEVFGTGENVIYASLYSPSNVALETTPLISQGDGTFTGVLRQDVTEIDLPGRYQVRFSIGAAQDEIPAIDEANFSILERFSAVNFTRYELYGINLENISADESSVAPLNTLESDGSRKPQPIIARAQFTNLEGNVYRDLQGIFAQTDGLLTAVLLDEKGNELRRQPMIMGADGVFTASLRASDDPSAFDPPGIYHIEVVADNTLLQPISERYKLVDVSPKRIQLLGREFTGLVLSPVAPVTGEELPLDLIRNEKVVPQDLSVSVALLDQDNKALSAVEALGIQDNETPVVRATLRQAGIVQGTVDLSLDAGSSNTFSGTIPANGQLGQGGEYTVTFSVLDGVDPVECLDRSVCFTWIATETEPVLFKRIEHFGITVAGVNTPVKVPLNIIENGQQIPVGFEVRARLEGVGNRTLPLPDEFLNTLENVITATLFDANGDVMGEPVSMTYDRINGEFVAVLRGDVTEPDAPGQYSLLFELNADAVKTDNPIFTLVNTKSERYDLTRYELVGLRFRVISPASGSSIPLNNVESERAIPEPIEVRIALTDQEGNYLPIFGVFQSPQDDEEEAAGGTEGAETDELVVVPSLDVMLTDPNGLPVETAILLPSETEASVFAGTLRNNVTVLDREGFYSLSGELVPNYAIKPGDLREFYVLSPQVEPVTFMREEFFGIRMVPGEVPQTVALNSVDAASLQQVPLPVEATLRLQLVNDDSFVTNPAQFLTDPNNTVFAVLSGPNDVEYRTAMMPGGDGVFRVELGAEDALDPEGTYTLRFEFADQAIASDQPYQVVSARSDAQMFTRQEMVGVQLVLLDPAVHGSTVKSDVYRSISSALRGDAEPVDVVFDLQNTKGERLEPLSILKVPDTARLLETVQVYVAAPDDPEDRLGELVTLKLDNNGTLHGSIPGSAKADYEGRLSYRLVSDAFAAQYVNLSDVAKPARVVRNEVYAPTVVRIITGILGLLFLGITFHMARINTPFFKRSRAFVDRINWEYSHQVRTEQKGNFTLRAFPPRLRWRQIRRDVEETIEVVRDNKPSKKKLHITVRPAPDTSPADRRYSVTARLDDTVLFTEETLVSGRPIQRSGLKIMIKAAGVAPTRQAWQQK